MVVTTLEIFKKALLCIQAYWVGEDGNITDNSLDLCADSIEFF